MRVHERRGRERVVGRHAVGSELGDLGRDVGTLQPERLVALARRVAVGDPLLRPPRRRRPRVGLAVFAPPHREPVVQDPTGVQRLVGVVEHRERRDRGEVRRPRGRDEELGSIPGTRCRPCRPRRPRPRAGRRRSRSRRSRRATGAVRSSRTRRPSIRCRAGSRPPSRSRGSGRWPTPAGGRRGSTGRSRSTRPRWGRGRSRPARAA